MAYEYTVKGQKVALNVDEDFVAVRFREPARHSTRASVAARSGLGEFSSRLEVPEEKFTIFKVAQTPQPRNARFAAAIEAVNAAEDVSRVAPVFKVGNSQVVATDRLLVGFKPQTEEAEEILEAHGCEILEQDEDEYLVQLDEAADPFEVVTALDALDEVDYAEPDFVTLGSHIPRYVPAPQTGGNDPLAEQQYAIEITKALDAWNLQIGDPSVKIAILDEGVDTAHEDLAAVIVGSYDAVDNDNFQEPKPWDAHGTACAGLAAAIHGNQRGVKGVGGGCSLMAVRIAYSPANGAQWETRNSWIKRAIDWSWKNGAAILSNSWGGGAPSSSIINAFERARTQGRNGKGCVIIIAAGNDSGPVDFPGNLANVFTVSASNEYDEFKTRTSRDGESWWGSNFGPEVDVSAPGVHNYTTDISGNKGYNTAVDGDYVHNFNGTSSATPIVAGAAGLILSADPNLIEAEVRQIIRDAADKVGAASYVNGRNDQMGHGRLNVLTAVEATLGVNAPIKGVIKQAEAPKGPPIGAFVLETDEGEVFFLRTYQGFEAIAWDVLEARSLAYLARFSGKRVTVYYTRRQNSTHGSILWGVSVGC
jgi:thermitase